MKRMILILLLATACWAQDPLANAATGYFHAWRQARSWEDLTPYLSRDSSAALTSLTAENRDRVFVFYQKMQNAAGRDELKVADQQVDGDHATLVLQAATATASDGFQGLKLNMVREDGQWMVDIAKVVRAMGQ